MTPTPSVKAFVVLNPMAGKSNTPTIRTLLNEYFTRAQWDYRIYETTGQEDVVQVVRQAIDQGFNLFVAAGGDGTVSNVADGLVHTGFPLGILPVGTGNALARELNIPLNLRRALQILVNHPRLVQVDAMQVGRHFFIQNISAGFDSIAVIKPKPESKRRFGLLAYIWAGLKTLSGLQPECFTMVLDGQASRFRASQVVIANAAILWTTPLQWGTHIHLNDGQVDICIIHGWTILDYLILAWELAVGRPPHSVRIRYLTAKKEIVLNSKRILPVQGDGEMIGCTPLDIRVVPQALQLIGPFNE